MLFDVRLDPVRRSFIPGNDGLFLGICPKFKIIYELRRTTESKRERERKRAAAAHLLCFERRNRLNRFASAAADRGETFKFTLQCVWTPVKYRGTAGYLLQCDWYYFELRSLVTNISIYLHYTHDKLRPYIGETKLNTPIYSRTWKTSRDRIGNLFEYFIIACISIYARELRIIISKS